MAERGVHHGAYVRETESESELEREQRSRLPWPSRQQLQFVAAQPDTTVPVNFRYFDEEEWLPLSAEALVAAPQLTPERNVHVGQFNLASP